VYGARQPCSAEVLHQACVAGLPGSIGPIHDRQVCVGKLQLRLISKRVDPSNVEHALETQAGPARSSRDGAGIQRRLSLGELLGRLEKTVVSQSGDLRVGGHASVFNQPPGGRSQPAGLAVQKYFDLDRRTAGSPFFYSS